MDTYSKYDLIKILNDLKIYQNKNQFDRNLTELSSMLDKMSISEDGVVEILAGFMIDRYDNMLANTQDSRLIETINELAENAFKLYVYARLKQRLLSSNFHVKWVAEFKGEGLTKVESQSLEELIDELKRLSVIKKILNSNVVELIRNPIITSEEELVKHLDIIRELLERKEIILVILPSDEKVPLFFKKYYRASNDEDKIKRTTGALIQIIDKIKSIGNLITDENIKEYLDKIVNGLRKIVGGKDLLSFSENNTTQHTVEENGVSDIPSIYIRGSKDVDKVIRKNSLLKTIINKVLGGKDQVILAGDNGYNVIRLSKTIDPNNNKTYITIKLQDKEYARIEVNKMKKTISSLRNMLIQILKHVV